jgi:hypothetical protein
MESSRDLTFGKFKRTIEAIEGSSHFLQLFSRAMVDDPNGDALPLFELGLALLLDKPIVLLHDPGDGELPRKLRRIADHVIAYDRTDPESSMPELLRVLSQVRDGGN